MHNKQYNRRKLISHHETQDDSWTVGLSIFHMYILELPVRFYWYGGMNVY